MQDLSVNQGFSVMADNWVISPILPAKSGSIGVNVSSAGLLISAYMIPFGIFQLIFGPLADRFGKKLIINISMTSALTKMDPSAARQFVEMPADNMDSGPVAAHLGMKND